MKRVIIHMSSATERASLVQALVDLTGAEVFEAVVVPENPVLGCATSHRTIYESVLRTPDEDLLLFEDDCMIVDPSFLALIEEKRIAYDLIYIGVNSRFLDHKRRLCSYGTHAMWISAKALRAFRAYPPSKKPIDHLWNDVAYAAKLKVWRPTDPHKYVRQQPDLVSYISGSIRR
jgi:hypothetical protein